MICRKVDPLEGGSCNDYDYVCGDPINQFDLGGTHCQKTKTVTDERNGKKKTVSHNGHWKSWGCKAARIADEAAEDVTDAGRVVLSATRSDRRVA